MMKKWYNIKNFEQEIGQAERPTLQKVDQILGTAPTVGPPSGFVHRFETGLAHRLKRSQSRRRFSLGLLLLTFALSLFLWSMADTGQTLYYLVSNVEMTNSLVKAVGQLMQSTLVGASAILRTFSLLAEASLHLMQHSFFLGYAILTGGFVGLWVQLLRRLNLSQETQSRAAV